MRTSGTRTFLSQQPVPTMPPGLVDLMEGMTKEVLRNNPTDIYEFCADHMRKLLEIRDGFAQREITPSKLKQNKIQYEHEIKPKHDCKEEITLLNNYEFNENFKIPDKQVEESVEGNLLQNIVKTPVRRELDLMETSEIEITEEFINPGNETRYLDRPKSFEVNENYPTDDANDADTTNLQKGSVEIKLIPSTDRPDGTNVLEENQTNITNYTETTKEENIQASSVTNEMDISEKEDEINIAKILQEKSDTTRNDDVFTNNHPLQSDQIAEDTMKITPDKNISMSHDINQLKITNEEVINSIVDENAAPIGVIENPEQKQITPVFENIAREENSSELKITTEVNEYEYDNHGLIEEKQDCMPSEIKETDESDIPKEIIILKADEDNDCFAKNDTNGHIDSNDEDNSNIYATNKNDSVCDKTDVFNAIQDLGDDHFEDLDTNLHMKKDLEGDILFENDDYNNRQVESGNPKSDNNKENVKEIGVVEETKEKIEDFVFNESSDIIHDNDVIVEKSETIDNSRSKDWEITNESSNMDLETAAITIQKVFRSFLYKSRGSTFEDLGNDEIVINDKEMDKCSSQSKERRPLGITRIDSVLQTVNEEKSLSLSTDDSSTLSSAATIIQAHVRGFLLRNKINSGKTLSMNSVKNSDSHPAIILDDGHHQKNKTVLNIHIVPEENKSFSRDETVINSVDLSLDCSPPGSVNLHPLGYDKSEPRKQLKREDAFQSVSPPTTNNSGKLSEDIESVREVAVNDNVQGKSTENDNVQLEHSLTEGNDMGMDDSQIAVPSTTQHQQDTGTEHKSLTHTGSDESDVITPFVNHNEGIDVENTSKLIHSGEFHDVVIPTKVTRSDTSVARGE